jgi:transposase
MGIAIHQRSDAESYSGEYPMSTDIKNAQGCTDSERVGSVTGPHTGYDKYGRLDHYYWRCERCGFEATASELAHGCWRCGEENDA